MKKQFFLIGVLAVLSMSIQAQPEQVCACSHSFFSIRPPFQNSTPENITLFYNDAPLRRDCGWGGAIEIVGFGGRSTRSKDMARFFTPNCSDTVIFAESAAFDGTITTNPNERDVNATFFNIRTLGDNFASVVQFRPRQSYAGVGFAWKQYFDWWRCDQCPRWWFEVSFPVEWVKNDMRLTESIINQGTPPPGFDVYTSVKEAFTCTKAFVNNLADGGSNFVVTGSVAHFGCIDGARKKTGVADLEFKVGYDFITGDCCHLDGYIGFVAPTGNKPKGVFVFEPIIGNNHHWGFMWGGSYGGIIWEGCNMDLRLEIAMNGRYLFKNTQVRSFDVNGKPWSRYMLVYTSVANAASETPAEGINFFTQRVNVKPHAQQHINTALIFDWCSVQFDIGYHLWAAQCERVTLKDPFPTGLAFIALGDGNDISNPSGINRAITIKENFSGATTAYAAPLTITENDLNLGSAAMPCALTHSIYGALGYHADCWCLPVFLGVGGSYEWTPNHVNTALNRWMVWGKIGVSI